MLRSIEGLLGYTVRAQDGDMGKVHDFYFHDDSWVIRYLVVNTGHWLPGRRVLITPGALGRPNWVGFTFPVALTREQVRKSPKIDTDKLVSRQQEVDLHNHYDWPGYWGDPGLGIWPPLAPAVPLPVAATLPGPAAEKKADTHLRSAKEVLGYHIRASDGELGHVSDFVADDSLWGIRYQVVQTGHWLPAKQVLISPQWLGETRWPERNVNVNLTQAKILDCPEFYPEAAVNREYEGRLDDYYGQPTNRE